ncbi:hypothetical protein ABZT30_46355 [Streptomyces mirabilis]
MEEHLRAAAVQFEVAEFVDFEKVDAPAAGEGLAQLFVVGVVDRLVHQGGRDRGLRHRAVRKLPWPAASRGF